MDERTLDFRINAIETFLDVKFHGATLAEKQAFVHEHHARRVEVTTLLMKEAYEDEKGRIE